MSRKERKSGKHPSTSRAGWKERAKHYADASPQWEQLFHYNSIDGRLYWKKNGNMDITQTTAEHANRKPDNDRHILRINPKSVISHVMQAG